jgi:acetate kinase
MNRQIVTLNAGSSSIKFAVFDEDGCRPTLIASGLAQTVGGARHIRVRDGTAAVLHDEQWSPSEASAFHADALHRVFAWRSQSFPDARVAVVGHRVVHGGVNFDRPVVVTDDVLAELAALAPLAPLHQLHNIAGIFAARAAWPDVPQVACFDTAFHRGHPFVHDVFALPRSFYRDGVRCYGFHGLSYEYVMGRLRAIAPLAAAGRVVVAHLGNGASMCAILDGASVACTMGFSSLDGLPMGTRCGRLDPGVILYLLQEKKLGVAELSEILWTQSGLKGLSGISNDMRELEASDQPQARETIEYFVSRVRYELGGLAAALDGLDAIAFCGGVGENSWSIRDQVLEGMEWIGIDVDQTANRAGAEVISSARSGVRVFVIRTDEEAIIARHAAEVLALGVLTAR